jgi:hypothetical protein
MNIKCLLSSGKKSVSKAYNTSDSQNEEKI